MKPTLEAPRSSFADASLEAFERVERSFAWNWHYHPEFELTWIRSGSGTRLVGDHSADYAPGDLVLLGPNLPHTWFTEANDRRINRALVSQFRSSAIPASLLSLTEFSDVGRLLAKAGRGLSFPRAVAHRLNPQMRSLMAESGLGRWMMLLRLLDQLADEPSDVLASSNYRNERSARLSHRAEEIARYLQENCANELPAAQVARRFGLSEGAFSRFFHRTTGTTFRAYRNHCRIQEACRLLIETDDPITDVALESGFGNLANFNRRFREQKRMTPTAYRRLHQPR